MVREKRDQADDDHVESGRSESVPQDERSGDQEDRAPNERPGGNSAEPSGEQSADADNVGDVALDEGQDDLPIAEPASAAATSGADNPGPAPSDVDRPIELPPPVPLPPPAIASDSLIAPSTEAAGE